jgi:type I restriction enzyme S subunit
MERYELPDGWKWSTIEDCCAVNQRDPALRKLPDELMVSFVPMAAVDADKGIIAEPINRPLKEVKKGFTPFSDCDVIFARITPCMENGKAAIAHGLTNGLGFGSTEFHVMHPKDDVLAEWIYHYIRQQSFRDEAKAHFTGTAGQLRVPDRFVRTADIPLPPLPEQRRIVAKIERLFAQSRLAREALARVPELMAQFRRAVLASAFRGGLVERDPHDEPASVLLERVRKERRRNWEESLRAKGKDPARYTYQEPEPPDTSELPELPEGWEWTTIGKVCEPINQIDPRKVPERSFKYIDISSIDNSRNVILGHKEYLGSEAPSRAKKPVQTNDVLFATVRTYLKNIAIVPEEYDGEVASTGFCVLRTKNHISPLYLFRYLLSEEFIQRISEKQRGISYPAVTDRDVYVEEIPLPSFSEQQCIVAKIESLFAQAEIIEQAASASLRRAGQVDQSILARAFRGEL